MFAMEIAAKLAFAALFVLMASIAVVAITTELGGATFNSSISGYTSALPQIIGYGLLGMIMAAAMGWAFSAIRGR